MGKVHFESQKYHSASQLVTLYNHNLRLCNREHLEHIDPARTYLNHDLANPGNLEYRMLVEERIQSVSRQVGTNIRKRRDAVIACAMILSYSHGADVENGFSVEEWERATYQWLQGYFGAENVVSAIVHLDESNPHMHAVVVPITPDNRLCAKEYTGGRGKMAAIYRSYSKVMEQPPFCLEPVQSYSCRRGSHEGIKEFYRQINDIEEYTLPEKDREESMDAYLERLTDYVKKRDRRHLSDVKYLELQIRQAAAATKEVRVIYRQAINLYQYLCRVLGSEKAADRELLKLYELEHYPRAQLEQNLAEFRQKYELNGHLVKERDAFMTELPPVRNNEKK